MSNSRYIDNETRYIIHNALQDLGYWSVLLEYLQDVAELDKGKGRLDTVEKRQQLIDFVAGMVDQGIELIKQRVLTSVATDKRLRKFWYRKLSSLSSKVLMKTSGSWGLEWCSGIPVIRSWIPSSTPVEHYRLGKYHSFLSLEGHSRCWCR
jgi:hypothetical protein